MPPVTYFFLKISLTIGGFFGSIQIKKKKNCPNSMKIAIVNLIEIALNI